MTILSWHILDYFCVNESTAIKGAILHPTSILYRADWLSNKDKMELCIHELL